MTGEELGVLLFGADVPMDGRKVGYCKRVADTFAQIQPFLPAAASTVLDVGCGMGGLGLVLAKHYGEDTQLLLLDGQEYMPPGEHRPKSYRAFDPKCRPWNDAGPVAVKFHALEVTAASVVANPRATYPTDVIVSTRSWGHHYPATVYSELALRSLRPGGVICLEIRNKSDGREHMDEHFKRVWAGPAVGSAKCTMTVYQHK